MTKPMQVLSPRLIEIRDLILDGHTDKEIAAQLDISEETVGNHIRRLYRKLCVRSRFELFAKCMTRVCQLPDSQLPA